jgi:hypothetical protein
MDDRGSNQCFFTCFDYLIEGSNQIIQRGLSSLAGGSGSPECCRMAGCRVLHGVLFLSYGKRNGRCNVSTANSSAMDMPEGHLSGQSVVGSYNTPGTCII